MKRSTLIILSSIVIVLALVVVAGIVALYSGVEPIHGESDVTAVRDAGTASSVSETPASDTETPAPDAEELVKEAEAALAAEIAEAEKRAAEEKKAAEKKEAEKKEAEKKTALEFKVTNCGTGKKNTLRQNPDNTIELIDEKGKSLWKVKLSGRLCGRVYEVDYYKNRKIQFLMCEGKNLHLIDRLGREVGGFPMRLAAPATDGLSKVRDGVWKIAMDGKTAWYSSGKISSSEPK